MKISLLWIAAGIGFPLFAQLPSSLTVSGKKGEETVAVRNVSFEIAGGLAIRKTEQTRQVLNEKGMEASTFVEAWPLAADRKGAPVYTVKADGVDARTLNSAFLTIRRGLEDVEWWSVYRLADGKPLFDTYVPLAKSQDGALYAGLDVPADGDPRLKDPGLIGMFQLVTVEGAVRRLALRAGDAKRAQLLRSYWDVRRTLTFDDAKQAFVLTIRDANPDVVIEIPQQGVPKVPAGIRCDILAR
ncbi:MAG TPA: hypothetical protein VFQ91_04535 [Bryobacteraceae bacterium]|nr:hypothetical protein [Bryobacteraceae bacterium]